MAGPADRQRLDKWLWFARFVRTRSLAVKLIESGHVRVNGRRAEAPAQPVRRGDVLTLALVQTTRVVAVVDLGERRGPAPEAQALYRALDGAAQSGEPPGDESSLAPDDGSG